jgi:hypothetical protein
MRRCDVESLDPTRSWWVPAVVAPSRDWAGAPGCRRGAGFVVDVATMHATRDGLTPFGSRVLCLDWIMNNRAELNRTLPGAAVRAVMPDRWLLGLD